MTESLKLRTCPKLLALLEGFYQGGRGDEPPVAEPVGPEEMVEPYRSLLVHNNDMTSTLTDYYAEPIVLRVLQRNVTAAQMARHIVLVGEQTGRAVEYGAIRINLNMLSASVRTEVLLCQQPLGGILKDHSVPYRSCPGAFFRVLPNNLMSRLLHLNGQPRLYGRCNCLADRTGEMIAEVVEILPPADRDEVSLP